MAVSPALTWLRQHGNQRYLCRLVEAKTGRNLDPSTVSRWARNHNSMTAATEALVVLVSTKNQAMPTFSTWLDIAAIPRRGAQGDLILDLRQRPDLPDDFASRQEFSRWLGRDDLQPEVSKMWGQFTAWKSRWCLA